MKYKIDENSNKAEILKGYNLVKTKNAGKVIEAKYLDGSRDYHAFEEGTINNLNNKLEEQMKEYTMSAKRKTEELDIKGKLNLAVGLTASSGLAFAQISNFSLSNNLVDIFVKAALALIAASGFGTAVKNLALRTDLKKYNTYKLNQRDLEDTYAKIVQNENYISDRRVRDNSITLNNLDDFSAKELEKRLIKVKRYKQMEG